MNKSLSGLSALFLSLPVFAATPVDLSQQPASFLTSKKFAVPAVQMREISRATDFNNTLHVRVAETYQGYPVWGGDAVVHVPQAGHSRETWKAVLNTESSMNGIVYQDINKDLANAPKFIFTEAQLQSAITHAISQYQQKTGNQAKVQEQKGKLIVYLDKTNVAHWAYEISFLVPSATSAMPERPTYILDAAQLTVYLQWNDIKTMDTVSAGGLGGNHKTGMKTFDGLEGNLPSFIVQRDATAKMCYMQNEHVVLKDVRRSNKVMTFACSETDSKHNNIYWNGSHDKIETTWSPSNDAIFGAEVTRKMFQDWYNIPVLVKRDGSPMLLTMMVHDRVENAFWDGTKVIFGDSIGSRKFNPFTQLDTIGHEICHGFTEQNSNLKYISQSGGLNEAFSDMAGIAAEYYAYGKTTFLVGWGDIKANDRALRYMEQPSKDCYGRKPGDNCSIDDMSQYDDEMDVHLISGIFNRVYYNLANTQDWNARKAFDVMVQANINYWTANTTYAEAACGVMKAARDYNYDLKAVSQAFQVVGINTKSCIKM